MRQRGLDSRPKDKKTVFESRVLVWRITLEAKHHRQSPGEVSPADLYTARRAVNTGPTAAVGLQPTHKKLRGGADPPDGLHMQHTTLANNQPWGRGDSPPRPACRRLASTATDCRRRALAAGRGQHGVALLEPTAGGKGAELAALVAECWGGETDANTGSAPGNAGAGQ